ncbi:polysaccharide deacetylase family protein [Modestobacter sp. URMC 112]
MPAWARWALLLVLVLVAASSWVLTRPDRSPAAAPSGPGAAPQPVSEDPGLPPGPLVSLTFDNGLASQYAFARPLLRDHGVNGTFYLVPDRLQAGESCCLSWVQAQQLYREGDEIGSYSADGVDLTVPWSADPAEDHARKREQVCAAHDTLARLQLDPRSFAYPAGKHTYEFPTLDRSLTDLVASCGYSSGRIIGGLAGDGAPVPAASIALPPPDPFALPTPAEVDTAPITLPQLQQPVTDAGGAGHWVPLVFGEVCSAADPSYATCMDSRRPVDAAVLSEFLTWLDAAGQPGGAPAGTTVRTVRDVVGAPPAPPLPPARTIVSLTFDDGDATQALAGDVLRDHGMLGTFYVNTGYIDAEDPRHLTWAQVLRLRRDGNDIGGHTASHIDLTDPTIPEPVKRDEVCRDRTRLRQMGLDPRSFAYPFGALDAAAKEVARSCGYESARSAGSVSPDGPVFAETVPPLDPFDTMALDGPGGAEAESANSTPLTLDYLQRAVRAASENGGGWVQVVLHHVCTSGDPELAACTSSTAPIMDTTLAEFLDWLQDGAPAGTTVRTVAQVMDDAR